jgi:uncharacterized protein (DUF2141 family)
MKTVALILGLVFTTMVLQAQDTTGVDVTVIIENVLSDEGKLVGSIHTQETFMKGPGIQNTAIDAVAGEQKVTFKNVAPGTFALLFLHDKNENNRMDFEANGMPKESFATSGDMVYGPPSFEASKFEVADTDLEVRIRF